jgi:DNA-binding CsgD family transcriptional regulator
VDYAYAHMLLQEALIIAREAGDKIMMGWVKNMLGNISWHQDDLGQAKRYYQNSLSVFREAHFDAGINITIRQLAAAEDASGNYALAKELYKEALTLLRNSINGIDIVLVGLASIASSYRQYIRTATLLGAVDPSFPVWIVNWPPKVMTYDRDIAVARAHLGEVAFDKAWAAGQAMTRDQAIVYALADPQVSAENAPSTTDQTLTERELEILHLISDGLNSREIAQQLVLSVGTIRWYLKTIYSKLDAHSRSEALARAKDLQILT